MTIIIRCLRRVIESGGVSYPIFIGFLPATELLQVAEAPSFGRRTPHKDIAANVLSPPVEDWQRPLNDERVGVIRRVFDNTGELMPNPVLLSENRADSPGRPEITRERGAGGETDIWEVRVPIQRRGPKPLWILDGQHRIYGLAGSPQQANPVPLVLLLDEGALEAYSAEMFAKLFAQVTTSAEALNPIHNEWLTYAFELGQYDGARPSSFEHRMALKTVAVLCSQPRLGGLPNPFFNAINFNPVNSFSGPHGGGFQYDCIELKELIRSEYFHELDAMGGLEPQEVALQVARFYTELLRKLTTDPSLSVFFSATGQKAMQDGVLRGALRRLAKVGAPSEEWDWPDLLDELRVSDTDWSFDWVETLAGTEGTNSKKVAAAVFREVVPEGELPDGVDALDGYLQGEQAKLYFQIGFPTSSGQAERLGRQEVEVAVGARRVVNLGDRHHVRLLRTSANVGAMEIHNDDDPVIENLRTRLGRGLRIDGLAHRGDEVRLKFTASHYGGVKTGPWVVTFRWGTQSTS